jgi:hypothetical protein
VSVVYAEIGCLLNIVESLFSGFGNTILSFLSKPSVFWRLNELLLSESSVIELVYAIRLRLEGVAKLGALCCV